jgi:flagellar export protein FliJ
MQAFEFRLEIVLRHKEKQKKLAKLHREQALQALLTIEAEIERLQQELRSIAASLERCLGGSDVQKMWDALHAQSRWLANLLSAAEQRVLPARLEFAKIHELYKQVASLVEALHNVKQRRWHEYKNAVAIQEQRRIEEFVLRSWTEVAAAAQEDAKGKESP